MYLFCWLYLRLLSFFLCVCLVVVFVLCNFECLGLVALTCSFGYDSVWCCRCAVSFLALLLLCVGVVLLGVYLCLIMHAWLFVLFCFRCLVLLCFCCVVLSCLCLNA